MALGAASTGWNGFAAVHGRRRTAQAVREHVSQGEELLIDFVEMFKKIFEAETIQRFEETIEYAGCQPAGSKSLK